MRRYQSHKQVEAARIHGVTAGPTLNQFTLRLEGAPGVVCVTLDWIAKRVPDGDPSNAVDGYFVRYDDGYESWSPAEAFKAGYTLVGS